MSTQATTWPKGLYQADDRTSIESAAGQSRTNKRPLAQKSVFAHAPAIAFSAIFATELALVAGGLVVLAASLATLVFEGLTR